MAKAKTKRGKMHARDQTEIIHVAHVILKCRVELGKSQETLGNEIGLTLQQVQKYERAKNAPPSGRVRALCKALGITPNELFGFETGGVSGAPLSSIEMEAALMIGKLKPGPRFAMLRLLREMSGRGEEEDEDGAT